MRMIDEDEVGLKEKPEDTKNRECGQRTRFPTLPLLRTADSETDRVITPWRVLGGGAIHTYHRTVDGRETPVQ